MLPLLRCPFVDFFGSFASQGFLSYLSLPLEGLGMPFCASRGFSSPSARLGPAGGVEGPLVERLVHVSSLLSPRFIRGLGIRELLSCGELLLLFMSRLALPPHLCTLSEVVRRVRLPSVAPVRFPPWPPDLQLERQGGYLSLPLVEWFSLAVFLLALSLRLPCSAKRSRRCERGSSR